MKTTSQHLTFAELADFAESQSAVDQQAPSRVHLSSCSACSGRLSRLEHVMSLMRSDKAEDAPRDIVAYAVNVFNQRAKQAPSALRRIVAALHFDSFSLAPAYGVRSADQSSRQLLYEAEDNDLELKIRAADEKWIIAGQILGQECVGGRVELEGEGEQASVSLNQLCEFTLPAVPAGHYKLRLQLSDIEIEVSDLELQS